MNHRQPYNHHFPTNHYQQPEMNNYMEVSQNQREKRGQMPLITAPATQNRGYQYLQPGWYNNYGGSQGTNSVSAAFQTESLEELQIRMQIVQQQLDYLKEEERRDTLNASSMGPFNGHHNVINLTQDHHRIITGMNENRNYNPILPHQPHHPASRIYPSDSLNRFELPNSEQSHNWNWQKEERRSSYQPSMKILPRGDTHHFDNIPLDEFCPEVIPPPQYDFRCPQQEFLPTFDYPIADRRSSRHPSHPKTRSPGRYRSPRPKRSRITPPRKKTLPDERHYHYEREVEYNPERRNARQSRDDRTGCGPSRDLEVNHIQHKADKSEEEQRLSPVFGSHTDQLQNTKLRSRRRDRAIASLSHVQEKIGATRKKSERVKSTDASNNNDQSHCLLKKNRLMKKIKDDLANRKIQPAVPLEIGNGLNKLRKKSWRYRHPGFDTAKDFVR